MLRFETIFCDQPLECEQVWSSSPAITPGVSVAVASRASKYLLHSVELIPLCGGRSFPAGVFIGAHARPQARGAP